MKKKTKKEHRKRWIAYCKAIKIMKEDSKKIILKYHSSIRIERPGTTYMGRILQRMRSLTGQVSLLRHRNRLIEVYRSLFPKFFRVLDEWPYNTTLQTQHKQADTSYSIKEGFVLQATTRLYRQKQLEEQVEWRIYPCSDGVELIVSCSTRLAVLLAAEELRPNL